MRKLLIALLVLFVLVGCGNNENEVLESEDTVQNNSVTEEKNAPPVEVIEEEPVVEEVSVDTEDTEEGGMEYHDALDNIRGAHFQLINAIMQLVNKIEEDPSYIAEVGTAETFSNAFEQYENMNEIVSFISDTYVIPSEYENAHDKLQDSINDMIIANDIMDFLNPDHYGGVKWDQFVTLINSSMSNVLEFSEMLESIQ